MTDIEAEDNLRIIRAELFQVFNGILDKINNEEIPQDYIPVYSVVNESIMTAIHNIGFVLDENIKEEDESK